MLLPGFVQNSMQHPRVCVLVFPMKFGHWLNCLLAYICFFDFCFRMADRQSCKQVIFVLKKLAVVRHSFFLWFRKLSELEGLESYTFIHFEIIVLKTLDSSFPKKDVFIYSGIHSAFFFLNSWIDKLLNSLSLYIYIYIYI